MRDDLFFQATFAVFVLVVVLVAAVVVGVAGRRSARSLPKLLALTGRLYILTTGSKAVADLAQAASGESWVWWVIVGPAGGFALLGLYHAVKAAAGGLMPRTDDAVESGTTDVAAESADDAPDDPAERAPEP